MKDSTVKKFARFVVKNHATLSRIISYFDAEDIEKGIIAVPEELVTKELAPDILYKASPFLENYSIRFSENKIHLQANVTAKQLGAVAIRYMLDIEDFVFDSRGHYVRLNYYEDVKSTGSLIQKAALKAASLKGSYLKTLVSFAHIDFIKVEDSNLTIDLDKIEALSGIPGELAVTYISAENKTLKFKFHIDETTPAPEATPKATQRAKVQGGYLKDMLNYSDRF